jgi:malate dehydrogenase
MFSAEASRYCGTTISGSPLQYAKDRCGRLFALPIPHSSGIIMATSIAILGASGMVGSSLAAQILRSQLLEPGDRLQLTGHGSQESEAKLLGTRIDLLDAFDEGRVEVEVVPRLMDLDADIVIVAAGVGMSAGCTNRRDMGFANREIFEEIAEQCALRVPDSLFIVVSNPVELAVKILCEKLDRKRVFGMGAQQDSLRFARAIAKDLGISRRDVRASVLGEHGQAMVPLWSTVELMAHTPGLLRTLDLLAARSLEIPLRERVRTVQDEVRQLLRDGYVAEAYEATRRALPDARIFVEPFITAHSMHSTPNATSNAVLQCIAAAMAGDRRRVYGQVQLEGEFLGLYGTCGVPVTLNRDGWQADSLDGLTPLEEDLLLDSAASIRDFLTEVLGSESVEDRDMESALLASR